MANQTKNHYMYDDTYFVRAKTLKNTIFEYNINDCLAIVKGSYINVDSPILSLLHSDNGPALSIYNYSQEIFIDIFVRNGSLYNKNGPAIVIKGMLTIYYNFGINI